MYHSKANCIWDYRGGEFTCEKSLQLSALLVSPTLPVFDIGKVSLLHGCKGITHVFTSMDAYSHIQLGSYFHYIPTSSIRVKVGKQIIRLDEIEKQESNWLYNTKSSL